VLSNLGGHTGDAIPTGLYPFLFDGEGGGSGGDGGGAGDGAGNEGGGDGAGNEGGNEGAGQGGEGGSGGDAGADAVTMTKAEVEALEKAAATANRKLRDAQKKIDQAESAGKAAAGQHEELYNQTKAELDRVTGVVGANAINTEVATIAQRLGFKNPALAHKLIDTAGVDAEVDLSGDAPKVEVDATAKTILEARLKAVLEADPYLKGDPAQRQLPGAGQGGGGNGGGANAEMNAAIRRASGRTA
jgi:hypothetical protein